MNRRHKPAPLAIPSGNYKTHPCLEAKYESCRPAPQVPCLKTTPPISPNQEVSHIDWDDDEGGRGKLARVKKSIGDLRAAALRTKTEQHIARPKMPEKVTAQHPLSPKSRRIEKADITIERPDRPQASRTVTAPTSTHLTHALYGAPPTPPPQQPLPPRPVTRPAVSAVNTRQSLPPLPARTTSHASNADAPPSSTPRVTKKPSTRLAQPGSNQHKPAISISPQQARRRAISDAPSRPAFSRNPSSMMAKNAASSPTSSFSQSSSSDSSSEGDEKVLAAKQRAASASHVGASAGFGKPRRRVSVLSVNSRNAPAKGKPRRGSAPAATVGGNGGLGRLRRWFRWGSKCAPPVTG